MGRYARQIRTFDMASAICWRSLPPTIGSELVCEPLTFRLVFVVGENVVVVSKPIERPPVGRSRWLRGRVGLGLIVLVLPVDGSYVAERGVPAAQVVAVDPAEDCSSCFGSGVEPVAVHELAFQR
jgi:hypothetical protein